VSPDWTGSPHHVAAGAALALGTYLVARRHMKARWAAALAVVVTMAAEAMVELVEYPLLFRGDADAASYYDTLADIGDTLVGAALGALFGLLGTALRRHQR
jgi:uncharacterized membrane protein YjdF